MPIVTDPAILAQLNSSSGTPVTDPAILAQLNAPDTTVSNVDVVGKKGIGREPFLRSVLKGVGGILGAAGGTAAGVGETAATAGFGLPAGVATAMAGGTLGYGAGGQLYDLISNLKNYRNPNFKPDSAVGNAAQDLSEGAVGELGGGIVGAAAAPVIRRAAPFVSKLIEAGPNATAATSGVRNQALAEALRQSKLAEATHAAAIEAKAAADAAHATATGDVAANQTAMEAAQAAAGNVKPIGIGQAQHLSEEGRPVQAEIMANANAAQKAKAEAFKNHQTAIDDVVKAQEDKGVYVNDLPETIAANEKYQDIVNPNSATAPTATSAPSSGQTRAANMVLDALKENKVELSPAKAAEAKALGYQVDTVPGGGTAANPIPDRYFRTFKTSLGSIDELNRFANEAAYAKGPVSGFEGISSNIWKDVSKDLKGIQNAYTDGLSQVQKDAYATALANADRFSNGIGGDIAATTGSTKIQTPTLPASQIPGKIIAGGADVYNQFKAITNPVLARNFANNAVERAFLDPVTGMSVDYSTAAKMIKPGTQLGDIINEIPEIKTQVDQHMNRLSDARVNGVLADELKLKGTALGKVESQAETAKTAAATKQAAAEKSMNEFVNKANDFKSPEAIKDKDVMLEARKFVQNLRDNGNITNDQLNKFNADISNAEKIVDFKTRRDAIVKNIPKWLGIGGVGGYGVNAALHKLGQ